MVESAVGADVGGAGIHSEPVYIHFPSGLITGSVMFIAYRKVIKNRRQ
ncbi:hypothetical protein N9L15_03275 [Euryarchaeota archaeon]|nr:hypothetical protein [Euryarchaeota archaeon]